MGKPGSTRMKVGLWIQIESQAPRPAWWAPHTELRTEGRIPASTSVGQNLPARHSGSAQNWVERQMLREKRLLPGRGLSTPHPDTWALAVPTTFTAAAPHTLGYAGHVISQGHPRGEEHVVRWGKVMPFARPWEEALPGHLILPSTLGKISLMHWRARTLLTVSPRGHTLVFYGQNNSGTRSAPS